MPHRRFAPLIVLATCVGFAMPAPADMILFVSDLQLSGSPAGQLTQPGWFAEESAKLTGTTSLSLTPTASGSSAGVTASLITAGNWETRGGTAEGRDPVAGTSFNDVVSDLWVTRTMSFTIALSGLSTSGTYRIRTWHNDSYNSNQGFAAGGGSVQISASGATVVTAMNGTVTNLRGTQTDSAFGIPSMTFTPTVSNPQISLTRVGGGIVALPVNGVELTAVAVPEPATAVLAAVAGIGGLLIARRRAAAGRRCRGRAFAR